MQVTNLVRVREGYTQKAHGLIGGNGRTQAEDEPDRAISAPLHIRHENASLPMGYFGLLAARRRRICRQGGLSLANQNQAPPNGNPAPSLG